jgi:signal transduction histidine kinase
MSSDTKANAVLAAAIIFLLLTSCAVYFAFRRLQNSEQWVLHTLDVQHSLDHFSSTVGRAGRLRAEYIDSGNPAALSRQREAAAEVRAALSTVQRLTADNASQQANCQKLAQLTENRLRLMDQAMDLKRSGKSTLESQVPVNREMMAAADSSETVIRSMEDDEQRLLSERQKRENASFVIVGALLLSSMFLALLFFLLHHQIIMDQVRERVRAENAHRNLSARLLTIQDEERRKFARELHDSVGQHLAAIKMGVSMLERKLSGDPIVKDCLKLADDAIAETRTISHLLHPPLLDEAGLNSAIRWFVEGFAKRSGIEVDLHIEEGIPRFDDSTELVLFRALQECLTNVHRHSGAQKADVRLFISGNDVILSVRDHGDGLSADVLHGLKRDGTGRGVGLAAMIERIREIGGELEISPTDFGTEVIVRVPALRRAKTHPEVLPTPIPEVKRS